MKALEYIQKKHLKGCVLKNGAAGKKGYSRKSGASSRRKPQTSHFANLYAKLNARFRQLPAPDLRLPPASSFLLHYHEKSLLKGGFFHGARYYAIIGLKRMIISR